FHNVSYLALAAKSAAVAVFRDADEFFKDFIGEQTASWRQLNDAISFSEHSIAHEAANHRNIRLDPLSKSASQFVQLNSTIQPQAEKETFLQGFVDRDLLGPDLCPIEKTFKGIGSRQAYAHDLFFNQGAVGGQHGMSVYAKAEIRLACPVLQVVPRLEPCARKIRYLVLPDFLVCKMAAGKLVEFSGGVLIGNKMRMIAAAAGNQLAAKA